MAVSEDASMHSQVSRPQILALLPVTRLSLNGTMEGKLHALRTEISVFRVQLLT